jgi:hypothetical protein
VRNDTKPSGHSGSRSSTVEHMSVGGGLHSLNLTESREGVERLTQGVAHHVIGVVVDVLVRSVVDIEDVSAPLTGGGESGLDLDVIIAGSPDRIHSHRLDQFMPVANFFI